MKLKPLSPNAKCPCGTGRKYKACCFNKGFHYLVDDEGNVTKDVPMHPEFAATLAEAEQDFIKRHGRPRGRDELLFDEAVVKEGMSYLARGMRETGVDPAYIYAFEKTGLMPTDVNRDLMSTKDVEEFNAAIDEYRADHGDDLDA